MKGVAKHLIVKYTETAAEAEALLPLTAVKLRRCTSALLAALRQHSLGPVAVCGTGGTRRSSSREWPVGRRATCRDSCAAHRSVKPDRYRCTGQRAL